MKKKALLLVVCLAFIAVYAYPGAAIESTSYKIPSTVLSGGGSPMSSASYTGNSTLGQPSPLMNPSSPPTSTSYDNYPGFWYGAVIASAPPTLIELASFIATAFDRLVVLEWVTASEIDNAGFNLYRAEGENGEYVKLNAALIPADGSPTEGAVYQFIDEDVQNRVTYYYKLEDIDIYGKSTLNGPVKATPRRMVK
jgi:hypothetical protein